MAAPLSVVILAKDEADRIEAALDSVSWAGEVLVADTGSSDGTCELARGKGARVVEIPWKGYVASRNLAHAAARHDWVLVLDADERVTPELAAEIRSVLAVDGSGCSGFVMTRLSHLAGRSIRHGTWYPDAKLRLGRRSSGLRAEGGRVHEQIVVNGRTGRLRSPLLHFPYRDVADAIRKGSSYARLSAIDRWERGGRVGAVALVLRPLFEFLRSLVFKRGFLDGRAGVASASLHAFSYFLKAAFLLELQRREGGSGAGRSGPGPTRPGFPELLLPPD